MFLRTQKHEVISADIIKMFAIKPSSLSLRLWLPISLWLSLFSQIDLFLRTLWSTNFLSSNHCLIFIYSFPMNLVNYSKNYYIYKLIIFLLCAMNLLCSRCFICGILVITQKYSQKHKEDIILPILQIMLIKIQWFFWRTHN